MLGMLGGGRIRIAIRFRVGLLWREQRRRRPDPRICRLVTCALDSLRDRGEPGGSRRLRCDGCPGGGNTRINDDHGSAAIIVIGSGDDVRCEPRPGCLVGSQCNGGRSAVRVLGGGSLYGLRRRQVQVGRARRQRSGFRSQLGCGRNVVLVRGYRWLNSLRTGVRLGGADAHDAVREGRLMGAGSHKERGGSRACRRGCVYSP